MKILEHILKNSKAEILATSWQPVGNLCEIGKLLATSWQPLRISQTVGNQFATLRNSLATIHCTFANFASHIKLQKLSEISHCQLRKPHCQLRKPLCQLRKPIAKFAITLPNSQSIAKFAKFANRLRSVCEFRKACELLANFAILAKIPTVLSSNFVLHITFSSELRFRRFWYRWKA